MTDVHRFRMAMAKHLGQYVSPEMAAQIEAEAFFDPDRSIDTTCFGPHTYGDAVFAVESLRQILEELHPLHEAHFAETERYRDGQVLRPDYEYMAAKERLGELVQFTVRIEGRLAGNLRMYLFKDLHTGTRGANEDTLYLLPEARVGFMASRFLDYAERVLLELNVSDVWVDTKLVEDAEGNVTRDVGVLLRRRGYAHVANRYHKRISKE